MLISYQWLADLLEDTPSAEDIERVLTFGAFEIESVTALGNDTIIDVDVLPNRASDCLSHIGIAREVATLARASLKQEPFAQAADTAKQSKHIAVHIEDEKRCPLYGAAYLTGVQVGPSPAWLRERLEALGLRSINNVVDATNYVMLELGTPLHAFDADKLATRDGRVAIAVRGARDGETITTLDEHHCELTTAMTVIADGVDDTLLAIAGVKGGTHAAVTERTSDIVLEAATFDARITRTTTQALGLRTDASKRFENDVPRCLPLHGLVRAAELIAGLTGGSLEGYTTAGSPDVSAHKIAISTEAVNGLLGTELRDVDVESVLTKLGFTYTKESDGYRVVTPVWRTDLTQQADIIEEIGRVYGYENLEGVLLPQTEQKPTLSPRFVISEQIRAALTAQRFIEVYTYSLTATGEVALRNALASDKNHLRSTLSEALVQKLEEGERHAPLVGLYDDVRLFEIGNVFTSKGERTHVGIGVLPLQGKKRESQAEETLARVEQALEEGLGALTSVSSGTYTREYDLSSVIERTSREGVVPHLPLVAESISYRPLSAYPFALRDIALWAPAEITADEAAAIITDTVRAADDEDLLRGRITLFDEFSKDGQTSYAFHLVFQSAKKTLSDEDVNSIMERVESALQERGCTPR